MPDSLIANNVDAYLTPWGAVNRLKSVFPYVEVDGEEGRRHVLETIARLRGDRSRREVDFQLVGRLAGVKNRALYVCVGDDVGADSVTLETYIVPGMPLAFEYVSAKQDENAAHELLTRCAAALGYEILKDRRIADVPGYGGLERRFRLERRRFIERRIRKERRTSHTKTQR
jgi:hypothetical protein